MSSSIGITDSESTIDETSHHSAILPGKVLFQQNSPSDTGPFDLQNVSWDSEFSASMETSMNRTGRVIFAQHDPNDYLDHQSPALRLCQSVFQKSIQLPRTTYVGTGKVKSSTASTAMLSQDRDLDIEGPLVSSAYSFPVQYILPRSLGASCQHAFLPPAGDPADRVPASRGWSGSMTTRVKIPVFGRVPSLWRLPAAAHAPHANSSTGTTEDMYEAIPVIGNEGYVELELGREYISPKLTKHPKQSGRIPQSPNSEKSQRFRIPAAFGTGVTVLGVGDGWIAWECMPVDNDEMLWKVCLARYD
ncbi:hypothetical protein EV426DRAFT_702721 [Tirmania nivea]|nr:hypothetical protein EV426DRAFT_702721 [Tirmania nivea]